MKPRGRPAVVIGPLMEALEDRLLLAGEVVLGYVVGAANTTYHYRPLTITATQDGASIWRMKVWIPEAGYTQSHAVASSGEIAEFYDLAHGGAAFNYSPEGAIHSWSDGLMRMGEFLGDFSDTGGRQASYYEFTKTATLVAGVTGQVRVRINAPVVNGSDYVTTIDGWYTITNATGASYDLWGGAGVGSGELSLAAGGYTNWAIVNPTAAPGKPNSHLTDVTDGHQLYEVYDWYGSTATAVFPGFYAKMEVKDSAQAGALNLRPGMTFELRADNMDFTYPTLSHMLYGSTAVSATYGVESKLSGNRDNFGSGVDLPAGQSAMMYFQGVISTLPRGLPPVAAAGSDQYLVDMDGN